jgi:flagellar FliL protein
MKKMILIGVAALLLIGISVGATMFLTGAFDAAPEVAEGDEAASAAATGAAAAVPPLPAAAMPLKLFYHNIQPEFVVNFQGKSRVKFLMIEMVVASNDEAVPAILDDHDPELRNNLLMMLAEQDSALLKTGEGKAALREQAKTLIDGIVAKHYAPARIVDVFITRLVMQ